MTSPVRLAGKLGRLPMDPDRETLVVDEFLDLDAPPVGLALVDWISLVQSFPMYGNDQWGDCVWAAAGHMIEAWTRYASGVSTEVTTQDLLAGYTAVTGFNPNAPLINGVNPTDNGTVIADMLAYWMKTGIAGHKILAYAQVKDPAKIMAALRTFGALLIGVNFPQSAMAQFNAGQPWTVVPGSPIEGGHAVHVGFDGTTYKVVTWGAVEEVADPWWLAYVEEVWIVITPEWIEASGLTPSGVNLQGLGAALSTITEQPNPFPAPVPAPTPPAPAQTADQTFAALLRPWVTAYSSKQTSLVWSGAVAWLKSKKLY